MNLRITVIHVYILIILFACTTHAQYNSELNVITINLEKENLIGMKDVELRDLLNSKIENDWNIIQSTFNNEFQIPIRIMIYKDERLIFVSMCNSKEKLFDTINAVTRLLNSY